MRTEQELLSGHCMLLPLLRESLPNCVACTSLAASFWLTLACAAGVGCGLEAALCIGVGKLGGLSARNAA